MFSRHAFRFGLIATGALLAAGCATPHAPTAGPAMTPPETMQASTPLLERKFQRAAKYYKKYRYQGQVVYCKKEKPITSAVPRLQCLTEPQLRMAVEDFERSRNTNISSPSRAGAGQGSIGG